MADTAAVQDETGHQILDNCALRRAACGPQEGGRIAAPVCALARNDKGEPVRFGTARFVAAAAPRLVILSQRRRISRRRVATWVVGA